MTARKPMKVATYKQASSRDDKRRSADLELASNRVFPSRQSTKSERASRAGYHEPSKDITESVNSSAMV